MNTTPTSTTADLVYFLEPKGSKRAFIRIDEIDPSSGTGERVKNYTKDVKSFVIEDVRGKEDAFTLDTAGFQFYKHTSKYTTFANDDEIRCEYYPESTSDYRTRQEINRRQSGGNIWS